MNLSQVKAALKEAAEHEKKAEHAIDGYKAGARVPKEFEFELALAIQALQRVKAWRGDDDQKKKAAEEPKPAGPGVRQPGPAKAAAKVEEGKVFP